MHLGLENKVVLLTGGTKGIGRTLVKAFLEEQAIVHFCSRTESDIETTEKRLTTEIPGSKAHGSKVDVSDAEQLKSWVQSCAQLSGQIDVIVFNAAALAVPDTAENWTKTFQLDLMGLHTMVQAALPHLEKSKGNIITISSVSGRDIDFTAPGPYGPAKAAVTHYTASLAHTLAPKGVRANSCSPGNIYIADGTWGMIEKNMPDIYNNQMKLNPTGRMGRPEEIANAVLFLASERASFVSGANLVVDGALCTGVQF